nr:unnamed protein product [Naegleria fowleri]
MPSSSSSSTRKGIPSRNKEAVKTLSASSTSNKPMLRLHYASRSVSGFITEQLRDCILQVAVPMNQKFRITGVLICVKDMFFQIIEGPKQHVETLYENLQRDPRHGNITKLESAVFNGDSERMFPGWNMKHLDGMSWSSDDLTNSTGKFKVQEAFSALKNMIATVLATEHLKKTNTVVLTSKDMEHIVTMIDFMKYKRFLHFLHQIEGGYPLLVKFVGDMLEMIKKENGQYIMLMESSVMVFFPKEKAERSLMAALQLLNMMNLFRKNVNREEMDAFYCNIGVTRNIAENSAPCVVFDKSVFDSLGVEGIWKSQGLIKKFFSEEEEEEVFTIVSENNTKISKEEMEVLLTRLPSC